MKLVIEPGVEIETLNPSWDRKFRVVERLEKDPFLFFRCEWTEPDPERSPNEGWKFVGFGVAHVKGTPIVDAWVISTMKGLPQDDGPITKLGMARLERHKCPNCKTYVVFKQKRKVLGPECVEIKNICPKCRHVEVDVLD